MTLCISNESYVHTHTHTHSYTHIHTHTHTHTDAFTLTHTGICIRKREHVRLRNSRAVWKGRGGGQELSAEVIRAPV